MSRRSLDAIIIGGGCAGFAAATALVESGARVLVLEARPGLGGRATAFTDPATGERVDNGQHILMGCYVETLAFLDRIGAADRVSWQSGLKLSMIDRRGHQSVLALPALPSPLHFLAGVLAWDALSWGERLSVLRIGATISPASAGHHTKTNVTVRGWLEQNGQAPRLCELLWEPLALAALNQSIDQAEASHFIRVLERVFGPDPAAAALVLPAVPLDELYAEPARAWLGDRDGEVRVNAPAKLVVDGQRMRGVRVRDEVIEAPLVISTVPWHSFHALFDRIPAGLEQTVENATALASLPIVTVNLWFDAAVMQEPLVGLPGRNFQWIFDRRAIVGGDASHLSLISSGAETIVAQTNDQLTAIALGEVRDALPAAVGAPPEKSGGSREALDIFAGSGRAAAAGHADLGRWIAAGRRLDRHRIAGNDRVRRHVGTPGVRLRGRRPLRRDRAGARFVAFTGGGGPIRIMISVLVKYSEIALKGKNRSWFVGRLVRNLHGALAGLHIKEVRTLIGRIEIVLGQDDALPEVRDRLSRVFGIANYSVARRVEPDFESMAAAIESQLPPKESAGSFRVQVRRADPKFPIPSPDLARDLGSRVWTARGWTVDLDHADLVIRVEIIPGSAFCYVGRDQGSGGLPMGTGGRLVGLLSGGIDSPVAAWRMMKRGCNVTLVHFHSAPFLSNTSQEKARRLAEVLTRYQLRTKLYLIPFGELQRQITLSVQGDLRVIIYRRLMLRIAQRIASHVRARALVTGDVIGQVASQTLDNMTVIDQAAHMPVFRPLVGMDKEEIIAEAQRLGTFDISIVPDQDSCTLFTPRHPETHARRYAVDEAEKTLPVDTMIRQAVDGAAVEQLSYPVIN